MSSPADGLDAHYHQLQSRYRVDYSGAYSLLVTPTGNHTEPIHRWFHFKEGYSHRLLQQVLKDTRLDGERELRIIDPFSGSGTTVTSALQMVQAGTLEKTNALAVETNPFLHLVSAAKIAAFRADGLEIVRLAGAVAADVLAGRHADPAIPSLSTFGQTKYFAAQTVTRLAAMRDSIAARTEGVGDTSQLLLQLCLATCIEPASKLRRDGRTLRYVAEKQPTDAIRSFLKAAEQVAADVPRHRLPTSTRGRVLRGDIRARGLGNVGPFDLCLFSPPYPNNIDYTEVYKTEAWMLGLIKEQVAFSSQRHQTLRSHSSLRWDERYSYLTDLDLQEPIADLLEPLLRAIPNDRYKNARTQLVKGYCDDMLQALQRVSAKLRPGAKMVCIVGNSLHGHGDGSLLVAADLLIARIAELIGFEIDMIDIARTPYRRRTNSAFMRESVIFASYYGGV